MTVLAAIGRSLAESGRMVLQTWWALVLGFALSGAVQTWVPKAGLRRALGDHRPASLARAAGLGVLSSSCSYAAAALAKTLFVRAADFTASLVFMLAATNLVIDLGLVLWLLIGWQFAAAEVVGGIVMVALLAVVGPRLFPAGDLEPIRQRLSGDDSRSGDAGGEAQLPLRARLTRRSEWADAAAASIGDLRMVRRELFVGFLMAGFAIELVPVRVWQGLFLTGHGWVSTLENLVVGPFVAVISFVCSVGNVALAGALWHGGAAFGGVVAFIFADLITLPLLAIYRRYYGTAITLRILGGLWAVMALAGWVTQSLFRAAGVGLPARTGALVDFSPGLNVTTMLDGVAVAVVLGLWWLARQQPVSDRFAIDPVCGMQVETETAPSASGRQGPVRFCSEHCRDRWSHQAPVSLAPR
jgi:uncharacterized membrane protein YraQ (UPF0718 family)/YHS domain-containing protein